MQRLYNHPFLTSIVITALFDALFVRSSSMFVEPGIEMWGRLALIFIVAGASFYIFSKEKEKLTVTNIAQPAIVIGILGSFVGLMISIFIYDF
jgi:hypothetical protein